MNTIIPSNNHLVAEAFLLCACLLFYSAICQAQTPPAAATNQLDSTNYICVQAGPYSKVWQRSLFFTNASGDVTTNAQSYTELGTGICYLSGGQYVDSVEEVESVPGGAQAIQGRYQVQWANNANTPAGAVTVNISDGKRISSTVFGLAYFDTASGSNAPIARLQNCTGAIVAPNQVIYAGAFSNITADLLYTYTKAGLSQDIILHQAPPPPSSYGLSDATTVLQVYTAFTTSISPQITAVTNGSVIDDQVLDFGDMKMGPGHALFLNGQDESITAGIVQKQWTTVNTNGTYLIESIAYESISNQLQQLPQASNLKPGRGSVRRMAFQDSPPSPPGPSAKKTKMLKVARAQTTKPRLKLDYDLLSTSANLTLMGDTTYFVSSLVNITGTTTIEGGTVVKYSNGPLVQITTTNIVCLTGPASPGIFTSMNDNTVGAVISGSTGSPSAFGVAYYLYFASLSDNSLLLGNLRFSYAAVAFEADESETVMFRNCQFVNCGTNVMLGYSYHAIFENVLSAHCNMMVSGGDGAYVGGVNITVDNCPVFTDSRYSYTYGGMTNCIFTEDDDTISTHFTLKDCTVAASGTGIYQTVGAGGYYLANGSTYRGAGTASIDPVLLTNLQTLTTYPPVVMTNAITNDYTFSPQALRNIGVPDLGYHYFPLDYALNDINVTNATITVLPGTALAGCGAMYGVYLVTNGILNCQGTATSPNYFVQYNTVQEQSTTNWADTDWFGLIKSPATADSSSANFSFTDWSVLADANQIYGGGPACPFALQNCQLYTGTILATGPVISATNCLFQRANFTVSDRTSGTVSQSFFNNLFWEGVLTVTHHSTGSYIFRDNLFIQTSNTLTGTINYCSNNAYVTTNFGLLSPTNSDVFLTNSPAFEMGALGQFYYPTTQTNLIHQGSQPAPAAGLYWYTVTTNNVIEGTNTVSIGFHYVATDTNGVPLGGEDGGVADYLEDPSGNGVLNPFLIFDQAEYPNEPQVRLSYWRFNTNMWTNEAGLYPTTTNDLYQSNSFSGTSVSLTSASSKLVYPVTDNNGNYFNLTNGSIRFWFQPLWSASNNTTIYPTFLQIGAGGSIQQLWNLSAEPSILTNMTTNGTNITITKMTNTWLSFGTFSNQAAANYFGYAWPPGMSLQLQDGLWYQFVLTYSPSNVAFYTNGVLAATAWNDQVGTSGVPDFADGEGILYYPPITEQESTGFSFGNNLSFNQPVMGNLDELETFNYPLTLQQVAAGYPYFGGNATNMLDTYYLGISDMLQTYVYGFAQPLSNNAVPPVRLGYWRFDSPLLYAEQGQMPLSSSNVGLAPSWSGTALVISNTASQITYPDVGSNGWANINCREGSLRFWFKPNSTSGPGTSAPFVYMGTNNASQEWELSLNSSGTSIGFITASNVLNGTNTNFTYNCTLSNNSLTNTNA